MLLDELPARGGRCARRCAACWHHLPASDPAPGRVPPARLVGTPCLSDSPEAAWIVRSRTPNDASLVTVSPTPRPVSGAERACYRHACSEWVPHPMSLLLPLHSHTLCHPVCPGVRTFPAHRGQRGPPSPPRLPPGVAASLRPGSNAGTFVTPACRILGRWGDPSYPDQLAPCRDGLPYCEADYHAEFGVRCDGCEKFITGHVLEVSGLRRPPPPELRPAQGGLGPPQVLRGSKGSSEDLMFRGVHAGIPARGLHPPSCQRTPS